MAAFAAISAPACSNSNAGGGLAAEQACRQNSDCAQGLICALGACRAMCGSAADCGDGGSCVDNNDVAVCQYAPEANMPCNTQSDCPAPLACASDYRCRNLCTTSMECNVLGITGRVCATDANGVHYCADPSQVNASGMLDDPPPPGAPDTGVVEPTDATVTASSGSSSGSSGGSGSSSSGGGGEYDATVGQDAGPADASLSPEATVGADASDASDAAATCPTAGVTGSAWAVHPMNSPGDVMLASMAYEPTEQRVLMGPGLGLSGGSGYTCSSTTATWSAGNQYWTTVDSAALNLSNYGMAFDGTNVVLFGGVQCNYVLSPGTYCWSDTEGNWTNACPAAADGGSGCGGVPQGRSRMPMVYDPVDGLVVMAGGSIGEPDLAEVWTWKSNGTTCGQGPIGTWTQKAYMANPGSQAAGVYDLAHQQMMFYGFDTSPSDTFFYDPVNDVWTDLPTSPTPGRVAPLMAYDENLNTTILVGGYGCSDVPGLEQPVCTDEWQWNGSCWAPVNLPDGGGLPPMWAGAADLSPIGPTNGLQQYGAMMFDGVRLVVAGGGTYGCTDGGCGASFNTSTWTAHP